MDKPTPHIESDAEYRAAAARAWYECAAVNPSNPLAVASQIEAAFKALRDYQKANLLHNDTESALFDQADKVLSSAS